jgi:hypothetical protein
MRIIFVLKVQESLKPFIIGPLTRKYLDIKFDNYSEMNEYKLIKSFNKILKYLKIKFSSVEPTIALIDPQQRLEDGLIELSRNTQSNLKLIRENLSDQLNDLEYKLANSQQRIADCLVEMNTKTTTNFETTKEESSDSIGIVEIKLDVISNFLNRNFFDVKSQLKNHICSFRQSFKNVISNLENNIFKRLEEIKHYLESFHDSFKKNQEEHRREFSNVHETLQSLSTKLDQVNLYLEKISEKLNILEYNTELQSKTNVNLIKNALNETNQKIDHQKLTLEQLPKYQPKIIINNLKERGIKKSVENIFKENVALNEKNEFIENLDLFQDDTEIADDKVLKQSQLKTLSHDLPFSAIKEAFEQTLKEVQSEKITEKPSETETDTKISELKSDQSLPKSSKQSDGKFETDKVKSESSEIPNKSVSPWLKRRLKQKERQKTKQPEESDDEN